MGTIPSIILALSVLILACSLSAAVLYKISEAHRARRERAEAWNDMREAFEPHLPELIASFVKLIDPEPHGRSRSQHTHH